MEKSRGPKRSTSTRQDRAEAFRRNLLALLDRHDLTIRQLCQSSQLDRPAVQRWVRRGADRVSTENLAKLSRAFGIDPPSRWFDANLLVGAAAISVNPVDRESNPAIEQVVEKQPALFDRFTPSEWKELYSQRGTGGELTPIGVERAARKIVAKRKIRRQFEALLETHHFTTLEALIEALYRDTELPVSAIEKKSGAES